MKLQNFWGCTGDVRTVPCPNIIGASTRAIYGEIKDDWLSGAFYTGSGNSKYNTNDWTWSGGLGFMASKSNAIYNGNKVQPPAFQILIIIKTWKASGWTLSLE